MHAFIARGAEFSRSDLDAGTDPGMQDTLAKDRPSTARDRFRGKRVHLIGIGGCGMQGAANVLRQCGAKVCGSDTHLPEDRDAFARNGICVHLGHEAENITKDLDLVVFSAAIPDSNPELKRARQLGVRTVSYAALLGELMDTRTGVAIAGSHGKSTTTGMTAYMFREAGLDPSYIVGADSTQLGGRSGLGEGEHFIVEACEYRRSFLHFRPRSAAILNIEADHLDYYRDVQDLEDAFRTFCGNVAADGLIVVPHGDSAGPQTTQGAKATIETFGLDAGATWRAVHIGANQGCYTFDVLRKERFVLHARLAIAGFHNVLNALAAIALARHAGADPNAIAGALASYEGVRRRMMLRGQGKGITIIDDYAHHPTEIQATVRAVRDRYNPVRAWVVFQPHQHSRTRLLMDRFADSFGDADFIVVPDIYASRDTDEDRRSVAAQDLVEQIRARGGQARHIPELTQVTRHLEEQIVPGDLVLTMGAGDVWKVADGLVETIRRPD
jgi:UDP-N-acetylmuramate--alanine ligase